jgi:hypothetical protein
VQESAVASTRAATELSFRRLEAEENRFGRRIIVSVVEATHKTTICPKLNRS